MSHITRGQALRLARESAYPRTANNPMEAQSLIGIDEIHKLCNAAIQHYIGSAALAQPEPATNWEEKCKYQTHRAEVWIKLYERDTHRLNEQIARLKGGAL